MPSRRPTPAIHRIDHVALLRVQYLRHYDQDPHFRRALEQLYATTVGTTRPADPEAVDFLTRLGRGEMKRPAKVPRLASFPLPAGTQEHDRYRADLDTFVVRWGLNRLLDPDGGDYVNAWCIWRQGWPETSAGEFSASLGWAHDPVRLQTTVPIALNVTWDPLSEPRTDARRRNLSAVATLIDGALEEIAGPAEAQGLQFADTAPKLERDLDWAYQLARHHMTVAQLAAREDERCGTYNEDAIRSAMTRLSKRLRLDATGWYETGRISRPDR
jgi:hypothetical protein